MDLCGWLGTEPGECPFFNQTVFIKKEIRKEDPYKNVAIEDPGQLALFWQCSEELSQQFPFKAELHQFMLLTAMRKTECLKMEKKFINFDKGTLFIPKGISKTKYRDEELPITPELEVLLRNILDLGERPGLEFYKMRDFRWLFATRNWKAERYFNKEFRMSHKARLGGDEKYIPVWRFSMLLKYFVKLISLNPNKYSRVDQRSLNKCLGIEILKFLIVLIINQVSKLEENMQVKFLNYSHLYKGDQLNDNSGSVVFEL
jgi:hypothetical protein